MRQFGEKMQLRIPFSEYLLFELSWHQVKHFIMKRHNGTIGCVWAGKLLPKLPPVAAHGSAPPVIAARG